jgi:hypothetical protein
MPCTETLPAITLSRTARHMRSTSANRQRRRTADKIRGSTTRGSVHSPPASVHFLRRSQRVCQGGSYVSRGVRSRRRFCNRGGRDDGGGPARGSRNADSSPANPPNARGAHARHHGSRGRGSTCSRATGDAGFAITFCDVVPVMSFCSHRGPSWSRRRCNAISGNRGR